MIMLVNPEGAMENNAGPSLRVLSRPSSLVSVSSAGAPQSSTTASSIPLSSSSIPYTPPASSFHFPSPPSHTVPSYPPPVCPPPLPSHSLLNSASSRPVSSNNPIHSGGKITILTSSAQNIPPSVQGPSIQSNVQSEVQFPGGSGQAQPTTEFSPIETPINNGIVVVGVVGRSEADASQLLNRILDAEIFGSRGVQKFHTDNTKLDNEGRWSFLTQKAGLGQGHDVGSDEVKDVTELSLRCMKRMEWMKKHLKYYHDEEKGLVYLQFAWGTLPTEMLNVNMEKERLSALLEELEGDTLRGLLYMFSVCHVVLLLQEGARVDTHLLRTLRILQNAKHLLAPYVKSEILPGLHSTPVAPESTAFVRSSFHSSGQSPGRTNTSGRNTSTIGLMSGSAPSFFPGQCTPVLLFVFIEELTDPVKSSVHDRTDSSVGQVVSAPQFGGGLFTSRQTVQLKGSNPVVMLARSSSKTEGGLRKKLQSSLEAQIRYLVKKCRILAGSGDTLGGVGSGVGPRGPGSSMSSSGSLGGSSLFVLDTMRVACLLDKGANLQGDALEAAMGVLNDMLKRKESDGNSLSELGGNINEDIQAIRDFIWKQAEILRGRGGVLANPSGGSMGVGMVAAAAAAAAASAASGGSGGTFKPLGNPPELPTISNWLSACHALVEALTVGEGYSMKETKKIMSARGSGGTRRGSSESLNSNVQGKDALGVTLGSLESGVELDMKFSSEWCKRMLPNALAAYTKSLPPCYPTALHKSQLEKALNMFRAMVRGPAVPFYITKLKEECEVIWKSGRQLCDAVSLTGKPCIHKVHNVLQGSSSAVPSQKLHLKGLKDINDERVEKQNRNDDNHAKPHSSGLVSLHACACGRSRRLRDDPFDYESANISFFQFPNCEDLLPSLQVPDCEGNAPMSGATWSLVRLGGAKYYQPSTGLMQSGFVHNKKFLQPWIVSYSLDAQQDTCEQDFTKNHHTATGVLSFLDVLEQGTIHVNNVKKNNVLEKTILTDKKQPPYVTAPTASWDERRLFVDVAKNTSDGDLAFPPLHQKQTLQRNVRQAWTVEKKEITDLSRQSESPQLFVTVGNENNLQSKQQNCEDITNSISFQPASRLPPFGIVNEKTKASVTAGTKNAMIFIGFEHECPHGHRFLLSQEQVEGYGSIGPPGETNQQEPKDGKSDTESGKNNNTDFQHLEANAVGSDHSIAGAQETSSKLHSDTVSWSMDLVDSSHCKLLNEGSGEGYNLLNMNLPIYMNCPYCNRSSEKKKRNSPAFAGNISQLQRIFLVTPSLPLLVAACPTVQFDGDCLNVAKQHGVCTDKFSLGCGVVLPPESFVVLRLPFIYYVETDGGFKYPLKCKPNQSEKTAWLLKGSTFKIVSNSTSAANV